MKKCMMILALAGLLLWGSSAFAAGEVVELKPVVQKAGNHFLQYEEPFETLEDMIAYDTAPTYYFPTYTEVGTMWAVQFTPAQACSLKYLQISSYNGAGSADIHVWDDFGSFPGDDLITPFTRTLFGQLQYQRINLPDPVEIGDFDFHAGFEYTRVPPPFSTTDGDGVTEDRSKVYFPDDDWYYLDNDLNIRAFVTYYGEDVTPPQIIHEAHIDMGFTQGNPPTVLAVISDDSGVDNAYVYYNDGSGWESIAMTNTGGNNYEADLPLFDAGDQISYYIQATDNSPNANTGYYPAGGSSNPIVFDVVEGAGIAYDDGAADGWWIVADQWDENAFAVRCTPSEYPATVKMARAYVNGADEFKFSINDYTGGQPGSIIAGPWQTSATNAPGWANFEIPEGDQPVITSGHFCVVFHWLESTPADPGVGGDSSDPDNRSFYRSGTWTSVSSDDFMLRAVVLLPTGVDEELGGVPSTFALEQNYPNPFNATTSINYSVAERSDVNLSVYNLAGQMVETLVDDVREAGNYKATWHADNFASGIYFYKLAVGDKVFTKKMNLLK
ncbi:MAG: T9SS type A sorting domain-containing protein [candidate division Zixibacteria bacterium]|nr:T9SS type A sorting domain-containing protein [candidate division Zixibacteria bacterium]